MRLWPGKSLMIPGLATTGAGYPDSHRASAYSVEGDGQIAQAGSLGAATTGDDGVGGRG